MIHKVLIANRGEIACRVISACRALGLQTVAVYSSADKDLMHCELADVAVHIGPASPMLSYLCTENILNAAKGSRADAVHPGYGFLSESPEFARKVVAAGLTWIGPNATTMAAMSDKARAREIAAECNVPLLPGSLPLNTEDTDACYRNANTVGYPLLVKSVAGGGGIGLRLVERPEDLLAVIVVASQAALKGFGDGRVFLERYIARGRHIEIQIFGFDNGDVIHVFDRDCSAQRRFQKIVEEAPAHGVPREIIKSMSSAAVELARKQNYVGPGTVEFIVDMTDHSFYFLEMNTRIQVEHRLSELVSKLDLVQMQIQAAAGTLNPLAQNDLRCEGSSLECRLYAENVERSFLPSPGQLKRWRYPVDEDVYIESAYREGDVITPFYDPMVAKIITHRPTREDAINSMISTLKQLEIEGIKTNVDLLVGILSHTAFRESKIDTTFVERHKAVLLSDWNGAHV